MARTARSQPVALDQAVSLSASVIDRLTCPEGKQQVFLRDSQVPGLRVRVSATGAKSFVVERKVGERTIRRTIGDVRSWTIDDARVEGRRLHTLIGQGADPEALQPVLEVGVRRGVTVGEAWTTYLADRKAKWGARHYADHEKLAHEGGDAFKRGKGKTKPGVLHSLMADKLVTLTPQRIEGWATVEARTRATQARLGLRMLGAFLNWCAEQPEFAPEVPAGAAAVKSRRTRETLGKAKVKKDALLREQLVAWFTAVRTMGNPVQSAYLQVLLLTGARPGEVMTLQRADINWAWRGITIHDKVEGSRVIPLTPYVASLIQGLPKRNGWVFASPEVEDGTISSPNDAHHTACAVAGISPSVTLHGLRRSFKSLTEWLDMPAGVVAQIMGHKPSATAEKHYTVRPLDLLRVHHERIEAWVLEQAGVPFDAAVVGKRLAAV